MGRLTDPQWVAGATYCGFYLPPLGGLSHTASRGILFLGVLPRRDRRLGSDTSSLSDSPDLALPDRDDHQALEQ